METLFQAIDYLTPFQWLQHDFMKHALLAVVLCTPLYGLLGTMVVSNRMAFFSDSLGHGAFTGIAIGALTGALNPLAAVVVFSILFALAITWLKRQSSASTDTVIGVFSSTAIAAGLMMMSHNGNFTKFSAYLIGDLLSITGAEILLLCAVFAAILLLWAFLFNPLLLISTHPSLAASRGRRTLQIEMIFAAALAVVVAVSIQWVGLLIINSMLVLPAAAARNIARNTRQYHLAAVVFALFAGVSGLIASYYFNTATGATIVMVAALLYFLTLTYKK